MRMMTLFLALAASATHSTAVRADDFQTRVAMTEKSAATFYVPAEISGFGSAELMVDTGSGYMTINEQTLAVLRKAGQIRYVKQLQGVLADGSELVVPVYAISALNIGGKCWLHNVEAAVFPGDARQILGLSALRKASPFIFSVDPPLLALSRCTQPSVAASELAGVNVNTTRLVD